MHKASLRFWRCYNNLPQQIQELAEKNFALLKENPRHPSLHFKKIDKFWSARVGLYYCALAIEDENDFIWVWIGSHSEYDRLIK